MDDQKKNLKQSLQLQDLKSQKEYAQLIKFLKPFGKHQLIIYSIAAMYWFLTGILKTAFEIIYQQPIANRALDCGQILGLIISSFFAMRYGRKQTLVVLSIFMIVGTVVMILTDDSIVGLFIGIFLIGISHYSTACLLIGVIAQYLPCKMISLSIVIYLLIFVIGKMVAVPISVMFADSYHGSLCLMLPISLLYLSGNFFISQSPRYLLDNNMVAAQNLIHKIAQTNQCDQQQLKYRLNDSFIWRRIYIIKYNYKSFLKYHSLKYPTYCLIISFLCLGVVGKCSNFVMMLMQADDDPNFTKGIQVFWISCFQFVGLSSSSFAVWVSNRRYIIFPLSIFSSIILFLLYLLHLRVAFTINSLLYDLAFLGMNATISIILYTFLFINAVQYYPHTIRIMGIGLMMSMYYLGQILQSIQRDFLDNQYYMMEMYFFTSLILVFHVFGVKETYKNPIKYQIKEIQQQQQDY